MIAKAICLLISLLWDSALFLPRELHLQTLGNRFLSTLQGLGSSVWFIYMANDEKIFSHCCCPFSHCSQIFFPSSLPTSAWERYAELLSKRRKTVRKLCHEHVVSPRRCFSIGKSMKRWKKSIGNELRRRLWSNASWMRRWERYSKITDCWYLICWGDTEATG